MPGVEMPGEGEECKWDIKNGESCKREGRAILWGWQKEGLGTS